MNLDEAFSDAGYILEQAEKARRLGELWIAQKGFMHVLGLEPKNKHALLGLARCKRSQDDLEGAEAYFRQAIEVDAVFFQAYLGLTGILTAQDKKAQAFDLLAQASTQAKRLKDSGLTKANIFFFLGEIELELNDLAEALGFFENASASAGGDSEMQLKIGDALNDTGNHKEAAQYYKKALEIDPELAHVYNRLGINYRKRGRDDLSLTFYKRALAFHPDDEHLLYNLARLYWQNGDAGQAAAHLKQALDLNPAFEEAAGLLKVCQKEIEKNAPAQSTKGLVKLDEE
jgi:tetratricopeptide (TPR) repeat protein